MKLIDIVKNERRRLIAPIVSFPILKKADIPVQKVLNDAKIQFDCLDILSKTIKTDFLFSFMDLSIEAEALGAKIKYDEKSSPQVTVHPIKDENDLLNMKDIDPYKSGRMPVYIKIQEYMKEKLEVMSGSYVASPFTLAGLLMGAENLSINTIMNPSFCKKVIEYSLEIIVKYAKALEKAGADALVILDPTAVLVSPKTYKEFILPYNKELIKRLDVPAILHTCGNSTKIIGLMLESGAEAISLDALVNMKEIAPQVPKDVVIMGNLDPVKVFLQLGPQEVQLETSKLLQEMNGIENFILSTGCDLPYDTPIENIIAFCDTAQ